VGGLEELFRGGVIEPGEGHEEGEGFAEVNGVLEELAFIFEGWVRDDDIEVIWGIGEEIFSGIDMGVDDGVVMGQDFNELAIGFIEGTPDDSIGFDIGEEGGDGVGGGEAFIV